LPGPVAPYRFGVATRRRTSGRGEPEDFGGIAVYLASKAWSYHTAERFVIDGRYSAF
jgi:NAD(P)-dependent dehydrogenase (short-subunit alcohol dehydrogenase family)